MHDCKMNSTEVPDNRLQQSVDGGCWVLGARLVITSLGFMTVMCWRW